MTTIAIIPARGGSRRIPRKNIRDFEGRPIIAYSIEAAKRSGLFSAIYVSTDDAEIAQTAVQYGATALQRAPAMAEDHVGTQEVMRNLMFRLNLEPATKVCCIYATCPLLIPHTIERGYKLLGSENHFTMTVGENPLHDAGQVYWGWADSFLNGHPLVDSWTRMIPIPEEFDCDINTEEDWQAALVKYRALKAQGKL